MIALDTYQLLNLPANGGTTSLAGFFAERAAVQPYITTPKNSSASANVQIRDGATILLEVNFTINQPNSDAPATGTVQWVTGENPTPDVPTFTGFPRPLPLQQGTMPGTCAANYNLTYVPQTAVLRVTGTTTATTGSPSAGIALSTRPVASFTDSGGATGTLLVDAAASLASTIPAFTPPAYTNAPDPANYISAYVWDYGDGTPPETTTSNTTSHAYGASGTFLVKLTVFDKYQGRNTTSRNIAVTVESGRLVSFCADRSGFLVRSRVTGTPKALVTDRHNGLLWEQTHSTATLQQPALSTPRDLARIYRIVQVVSSKVWNLEYSDDYGVTWQLMASPFDPTYKLVSKIAWNPAAPGHGFAVGLNASNVLVGKLTLDGGKAWATAVGTIGSGSKSFDLDFGAKWGWVLCADNLAKYTSDLSGATAWVNLPT